MGFAHKLVTAQKKHIYSICEQTALGEKVWFIVHVPKDKREDFLSLPKGADYNVADYGTILQWGYGDLPEGALTSIQNA